MKDISEKWGVVEIDIVLFTGRNERDKRGPALVTEWSLVTISTNWASVLFMCIEVSFDVSQSEGKHIWGHWMTFLAMR